MLKNLAAISTPVIPFLFFPTQAQASVALQSFTVNSTNSFSQLRGFYFLPVALERLPNKFLQLLQGKWRSLSVQSKKLKSESLKAKANATYRTKIPHGSG